MRADRPPALTRGFAFESTLARMARVLTGQYGVTVAFSPEGPRVEPGRIVIPDIAIADEASRDVLTGYLDLLAARARHSSLDTLEALPRGVTERLAQTIEDRRVCSLLMDAYPGARFFLARLREHAVRDALARWGTLHWRDRYVWRIERLLWDETPTRIERASHSLDAALVATQELVDAARTSRSTRESVALAERIVARVRALSAGDVNTMVFSVARAEDIDTDLASFDDAADDEPPAGDGESNEQETNPPAQARAPDQTAGMGRSPIAAAEPTEGDAQGRPLMATPAGPPTMSVPLTTEFDLIRDLTGRGDAAAWRALRAAARADTAPLKDRLERALAVDERVRWRREQERGELDRSALMKLAISPAYRTPFRVRRDAPGRDVAVSLLIDRSGSMAGRKIELARRCVAALCDALTQLSFDCEVLGYCSVESDAMQALYARQKAAGADLSRYNRVRERLDLAVYKRFGSADASGLALIDSGHENPDGEALAWAASRLADHPAARRILMVFSDGYPATGDGDPRVLRSDLRARIEAIDARGIEMVGIGVLTDAVEAFYPRNAVVSRLSELPSTVFGVLGGMLIKRS